MADTVTLKYGASQSVTLRVLSVKGFDDPDQIEFYPAILNTYLDGSKDTQFQSFRRLITIETQIVADRADRLKILYWALDNDRTIDYGTETDIAVVPASPDGFESVWEGGTSLARRYTLELAESVVRTTFPS